MNQQISELTNHYQLSTIRSLEMLSQVMSDAVDDSQRPTEVRQREKHTDVTTQLHVRRVKEGNLINASLMSVLVTQM